MLSAEVADRRRVASRGSASTRQLPQDTRRLHVGMPLARLRALHVVDTPGLGSGDEGGDEHTLGSAGADAVIWCTPAVQAWKASEERAWLTLPERLRQRGVLAVTFLDAVGSPARRGAAAGAPACRGRQPFQPGRHGLEAERAAAGPLRRLRSAPSA